MRSVFVPSLLLLSLLATSCGSSSGGDAPPGDAIDSGSIGDDVATDAPPTSDAAPEVPPPDLAWAPCDTTSWPTGYPLPAKGTECTTLDVPLDHAHPDDGRTFTLRVARQKSKAFPNGKVVFQLAGGPGGTSVGQAGVIPRLMPKLLDGFDLVYVDQRGTGGSGYLSCKHGYPQTKADWIACGKEHAADDLSHDLTADAADDLESVRQALGYGPIYVRAGSYGTRLGLELLRRHESSVAAIVLDGVDPPDGTFFQDFVRAVDRGVSNLVRDCGKSAACGAITTDVLGDLEVYRAQLKTAPRPILVDGSPDAEDEATFLSMLGGALFDASFYFKVPRAIHAAASGSYTQWDSIMSQVSGMSITEPAAARRFGWSPTMRLARSVARTHGGVDYVAPGLYATVVCAENLPSAGSLADLQSLQDAQKWGGDASMIDLYEACASWNVSPLDPSLRTAVRSNAKVLLLDGDLDLNTFPEWGAHAAETLPNGTNVVVPYATHSTMGVPCVGDVITQFFRADGDMTKVDASCIGALVEPAW